MKATLFTTSGCHLCKIAFLELEKLQKSGGIELIEEVEIANSETLMKKYMASIPVVKIYEHELYWPFKIRELEIWVKNIEVKDS